MYVFINADWAGDVLTRRSTTGYVVFCCWWCTCVGIARVGDSRYIRHAEQIPWDVCGDACDGVVLGGVVGDFTSFLLR